MDKTGHLSSQLHFSNFYGKVSKNKKHILFYKFLDKTEE